MQRPAVDPATGRLLGRLGPPGTHLTPAAFSPAGDLIAARGHDGATRLFERTTLAESGRLPGDPDDLPSCVLFAPDGRRLVVCLDGVACVWALER